MNTTVGIDIEEVDRFKVIARNPRFLARVFTKQEIDYCHSKKNSLQHFAVRFAAKEAVWKAMSEVVRTKKLKIGHVDIGVRNDASGKPAVVFSKKFSSLSKKVSLSLSHTRTTVVAVALFQR